MKLHFHGATYDASDTEWSVAEGEVVGKYRGKPIKSHVLQEQHRRRQKLSAFTYRGVHYTKG